MLKVLNVRSRRDWLVILFYFISFFMKQILVVLNCTPESWESYNTEVVSLLKTFLREEYAFTIFSDNHLVDVACD